MKNRLSSYAALLPPLSLLALLLWMPDAAAQGARSGLSVCAGVIIPSLFPFLLLSAFLRLQGLPAALARHCGPLLARLGLPPEAAAPFLLGLCGGYPAGAEAVAGLVRDGTLRPEEGARLLPVCNNTGPGFIVGVAGAAVFGSVRVGAMLYLAHVLAALTLAVFAGRRAPLPRSVPSVPHSRGLAAFPESVRGAVRTTLDVCGYVVFFSMLTALLRSSGVFSALATAVSLRFGIELRFVWALLTGLLELGSGIAALRGQPPGPGTCALAAFLLGFGGLSVHAQTLGVTAGTNIKCVRHFAGRIAHGLLSAALILLFYSLRRPRI